MVVEGLKHGYKRITGTATTPGLKEDQDAYHSKLADNCCNSREALPVVRNYFR